MAKMFKIGDPVIHVPTNRTGKVVRLRPRGMPCHTEVLLYEDTKKHTFITAHLEFNGVAEA